MGVHNPNGRKSLKGGSKVVVKWEFYTYYIQLLPFALSNVSTS